MAGHRKPGPHGLHGNTETIQDGTLNTQATPRPGQLGVEQHQKRTHDHSDRKACKPTFPPTLQQGSRGADVQKLQRLLNVRLNPSPQLAVDGIFGPLTHQAVVQFQKGASLAVDGIVGRATWGRLLKGDTIKAFSLPTSTAATDGAASSPKPAAVMGPARFQPPTPARQAIWEWPAEKKFLEVLSRVLPRLPGKAKQEFLGLLNLRDLSISFAIIAGFCFLSGGTALVLGIILFGLDVGLALADAILTTYLAATEEDLNAAADDLAHIIIAIGVAGFMKIVHSGLRKVRSAGEGKPLKVSDPESVKPATGTTPKPQKPLPQSSSDWPELSGKLRDAAKGKGNFGIGKGTPEQADAMGKAWVGKDATVASDGKTLVSKDGLRQYRPPSYKPRLNKAQANFEQRSEPTGPWQSNAHLDTEE